MINHIKRSIAIIGIISLLFCTVLTLISGDVYVNATSTRRAISVDLNAGRRAALFDDNTLWVWGNNDALTPVKVLEDVVDFSCGGDCYAAVKKDGSLWTWGIGYDGQIGDGTTIDRPSPVRVLENVSSVSCGGGHAAAIKKDGSLWIWGLNNHGQVGNGTKTNQLYPAKVLDGVAEVSCGYLCTLAVKNDGSLWQWGLYSESAYNEKEHLSPVKVLDGAKHVDADRHNSYIDQANALWLWNSLNYDGQIGDGTTAGKFSPVKILNSVKEASMGYFSSAAITNDGNLWVWGDNENGQLGDGTTTDRVSPKVILSNVTHVSLGDNTGACIKNDGTVWSWGWGPIGDGTQNDSNVPVQIYFKDGEDSGNDGGESNVDPSPTPTPTPDSKPSVTPLKNTLFGVSFTKVSKGKKSFTAKWKKASKKQQKQFSGYQIQYSTSPDFSGWVKTKGTTKKSASKVVIRKLKKKTTYYVRMRRYKKSGGGTIYSDWSAVKSVKTK